MGWGKGRLLYVLRPEKGLQPTHPSDRFKIQITTSLAQSKKRAVRRSSQLVTPTSQQKRVKKAGEA